MTGDGDALADRIGELGDEWARPDTRGVCLHDAHHLINLERSDAAASGGATRDWV